MLHRRVTPVLVLLLAGAARGNIAVPSLLDLAKESDLVVTGKVLQVDEKTATIQIDKVVAGTYDDQTIVITPNTVLSDIGPPYVHYKAGETVLLYLKKNGNNAPATVAGGGFGKRGILLAERETEIAAARRAMEIAAMKGDDAVNRAMLADVTSPNPLLKRDACSYISISKTFKRNRSDYAKELKVLLSDKDPKVLQSALFTLRAVDCTDVLPRLIELSQNADSGVAQCAAMALGPNTAPQSTAALVALTKHTETMVRRQAVIELGANHHDAKTAIAARLKDSDAGVRAVACTSLLTFLHDGKADDLIPQIAPLLEDKEYITAASASQALGETRNVAAVEPLLNALEMKRVSRDIQFAILQALSNHSVNDKDAQPLLDKNISLFISALKADSAHTEMFPAREVVGILSASTQPEAKTTLQWAANSHPNPEVRSAAARYLNKKN